MDTALLDAKNVAFYPHKVLIVYAILRVNRGHIHKQQYAISFCKGEWRFVIGRKAENFSAI
jgi:hypothetical protein